MSKQYNQLFWKKDEFKFKFTKKYKQMDDYIGLTGTNQFILESHDGKDNIFIVISARGKQIFSKKIRGPTTSFRMIDSQLAIIFDITAKKWCLINAEQSEMKVIQMENAQFWTDGQFQLEYFQQTKEICLIERNKNLGKLKLCFYRYFQQKENIIKAIQMYESQQNEWVPEEQIYTLNEKSCLGWCSSIKNDFKLKIYQRYSGFKSLSLEVEHLSSIFSEHQFCVKSLAKYAPNSFYLAISPLDIISKNQNQKYSPLISLKTSSNGEVEQLDFISIPSFNKNSIFNNIDYFNVGHFSFLKTYGLEQNAVTKCPIYIIDDDTQHIVKEEEWNYSANFKINSCTNRRNTLLECEFNNQNCGQMAIVISEIKKMNSLAYQRMLIAFDQAQKLSQKYESAIFIFGSNKSGKSTLRHFLSGHPLVQVQNQQLGYFEVKSEINQGAIYQHQADRERIVWISEAQNAVIIDIPDWNEQVQFFKAQTSILVTRIRQLFKKLHFVITIPFEYIDDPHHTILILSSVLQMIGDQQSEMAQYMSIVLTKVEDESSLQAFTEKNQEIEVENQLLGKFLNNVCNDGRVYNFMNQQFDSDEGIQLLHQILNSNSLQLSNEGETHYIFEDLFNQNPSVKDAILLQSDYLLKLFNDELKYISFSLVGLPQWFSIGELNSLIHYSHQQFTISNEIKTSSIACSFVSFLVQLKLFAGDSDNPQRINEIEVAFKKMILLFQNTYLKKEGHFLQEGFTYFITSLKLSAYLKINHNNSQPFHHIFKIYQDEQLGILGNEFKTIIKNLGQAYKQVQNCPELKEIGSVLAQTTIIKKQVPMSYEQQRNLYFKKKENRLQIICRLPCNVLKLDLMMQELKPYCQKQTLDDKDYRIVNFYLRQSSKICQYHELYFESLIFLIVIPDFISIGIVLDELIAKYRKNSPYDRNMFQEREVIDFIDELIIICRTCLRDNLLHKLIYIKSLNNEFTIKADKIRESEIKAKRSNLPSRDHVKNYIQMLKKGSKDLPFYNLKGNANLKKQLGKNKDSLIKKCLKFEEIDSKKYYEDVESMHWLIEMLPVPN